MVGMNTHGNNKGVMHGFTVSLNFVGWVLILNTFLCSAVGIGVKMIFIKCLSVSGPGNPDAHKGALGMLKFIYGDFEKNRVNGLKDACRKEVKILVFLTCKKNQLIRDGWFIFLFISISNLTRIIFYFSTETV